MVVVEAPPRRGRGTGWIVFAGIVMILAGGNMAINGLWALHATSQIEKSFGDTLLFSSSNLDTWGWIYLIVGAVVVLAGIMVFFRVAFGMMGRDHRGPGAGVLRLLLDLLAVLARVRWSSSLSTCW